MRNSSWKLSKKGCAIHMGRFKIRSSLFERVGEESGRLSDKSSASSHASMKKIVFDYDRYLRRTTTRCKKGIKLSYGINE